MQSMSPKLHGLALLLIFLFVSVLLLVTCMPDGANRITCQESPLGARLLELRVVVIELEPSFEAFQLGSLVADPIFPKPQGSLLRALVFSALSEPTLVVNVRLLAIPPSRRTLHHRILPGTWAVFSNFPIFSKLLPMVSSLVEPLLGGTHNRR